MSAPAIRVSGLGKRYRIGERVRYKLLRDSLSNAVTRAFRGGRRTEETIWALKDVSFEVAPGEVIGVIGRNGAGKSTLLKILSRITEPTEGRVELRGRVGSLLEVGTGFHLELTGRENIYLNGAILGMKRAELGRKFDEIVAFAEIEQFLDTPVKHYSTGMYLRLAFAVAAHLEPEILLVDEVLAVGDAAFQKKCLGKMGDVASRGRTVLFVSHNMAAVQALTRRCLYLSKGTSVAFGNTPDVVLSYLDAVPGTQASQRAPAEHYRRDPAPDMPVRFESIWLEDHAPDEVPLLVGGADMTILAAVSSQRSLRGANLTLTIKNAKSQSIAVLFSWDQAFALDLDPGLTTIGIQIEGLPLTPGRHFVDIGINETLRTRALDVLLDVPLCEIGLPPAVTVWTQRPWGAIHWPAVRWLGLRKQEQANAWLE